MKLTFTATRGKIPLYKGTYDVSDAQTFGDACADMWTKLAQQSLASATNIGAAYEALGDNVIPDLRSVEVRFEQRDP